jgi:hypothetical protein
MTTVANSDVPEHLAHEGRLQQCLRALQTRGWEQRLQPLATHMIEKRLVRARGDAGAPLRHLDLEVLRGPGPDAEPGRHAPCATRMPSCAWR